MPKIPSRPSFFTSRACRLLSLVLTVLDRSQSPHSAASSPGVETQRRSDPSVQADRGEQNEGFVALPWLLPSGDNATAITKSPCPSSVCRGVPVTVSQSRIVVSAEVDHAGGVGSLAEYPPEGAGLYGLVVTHSSKFL